MPELPDVEVFRRYLGSTALHQRVADVSIDRADQILEGVSARSLRRRLRGHVLSSTRRHGKYLFIGLDDGAGFLVLHFGMTGFLAYYRDPDAAPGHPRLVLDLENGYRLAYDSQRLLGRVSFTEDPDGFIERHDLGPDAAAIDEDAFVERLSGRRGSLKSALMDQSLLAGIGNEYSDEILFQARLHPRLPVSDLDERELRKLYRRLRHVLEISIDRQVDPDRFPRTWLLPRREEGEHCPRCGTELERLDVNGRRAWICPDCQPES